MNSHTTIASRAAAALACAGLLASCAGGQGGDASADVSPSADTLKDERPRFDPRTPWAHDPVVASEGDTVYAFSTGRGIMQMHSLDMEAWEMDGPCLDSLPGWVVERNPEATMHLWAPDIIRANGEWHLFYCSSVFATNKSVIGHLTNKTLNRQSPSYRWVDRGMILQSVPHRDFWNAIDPNVFICADGSAWMDFGSFWGGIKMVRLSDDLGAVAQPEEWHTLSSRPRLYSVESTAEQPGDGAVEAPFVFKRGDWYYLFVSFDYCCRGEASTYHVVCGRSCDIRGPYEDRAGERMDLGGGTRVDIPASDRDKYVAAGHCAVATLRGADYMALHAYRRDNGQSELILRKIEWDDKGWPSLVGE